MIKIEKYKNRGVHRYITMSFGNSLFSIQNDKTSSNYSCVLLTTSAASNRPMGLEVSSLMHVDLLTLVLSPVMSFVIAFTALSTNLYWIKIVICGTKEPVIVNYSICRNNQMFPFLGRMKLKIIGVKAVTR